MIGVAGFALAWYLSKRDQAFYALLSVALASALSVSLLLCGHNSLSRSNSAYHLAQAIKTEVPADAPFYSVLMYDQTLPFYLGRTLTLVQYTDELEMGIRAEPHKAVATLAEFQQRWNNDKQALALLRPDDYDHFQKQNFIPMRVIARDSRRIVIAKP
jgi:hypothetical protein